MNRLIGAFALILTFAAGPVLADDHGSGEASATNTECKHPGDAPAVPNGKKATKAEMIEAAGAVRQFNTDTTAYLECMDARDADMAALQEQYTKEENKDKVKEIVDTRKERLEKRNAAFETLDKTAGKFNEAVRDYKANAGSAE